MHPQSLIGLVRKLANRLGIDLMRYENSERGRLIRLLRHYHIDTVFDLGANIGQYGLALRGYGYAGRIVSFEPQSQVFKQLSQQAAADTLWEVVRCGAADYDGTATLHLSENTTSSSLLSILPHITQARPLTRTVGSEQIPVYTLDSLIADHAQHDSKLFVKMDVEGAEARILNGLTQWDRVTGVQLEMPLVPVFDQQASLIDLITLMAEHGFALMATLGSTTLESGQMILMDGIFFRAK